jgi:hypothetical protein
VDTNYDEIRKLTQRMDEVLYREQMMILWLKEGDQNMKFFHRKPSARAKKNKIKRPKKDDGEFTQDKKIMEFKVTSFLKIFIRHILVYVPRSCCNCFTR